VGDPAIVVGFGIDEQGGVFGEKRAAELPVSSLGDEMFLARGSADTCRGDSGGPVFAERREPDGGRQRRLVGVTSVGTDPVCGRGIGHYINLTRKVDWLEEDSQLDVTPCFDHGAWSPTAECLATRATQPAVPRSITDSDAGMAADPQVQDAAAARDGSSSARRDSGATHVEADSGVEENPVEVRPAIDQSIAIDQHDAGAASASGYLASCGPAFAPKQDDEAPKLKWTSPSKSQLELSAPSELGYAELDLEVAATDDGWGVKQVRLTLLDDHGQVLFERIDEVAPYGIPVFHVPLGVFTLRAEATDYAGNRSQADVALRIIGEDAQIMGDVTEPAATGCSYTSRARGSGWVLGTFALCVASSLRRGRGCRQP
jgi:hypothetical protein